jgi:integrase
MEPYHPERSGLYRPAVPSRFPRSVPDEEFNEIFAALHSHRDRALVAFYVSTGARVLPVTRHEHVASLAMSTAGTVVSRLVATTS